MKRKLTKEERQAVDSFWDQYETFFYWQDKDFAKATMLWDELTLTAIKLIDLGIVHPNPGRFS